MESARQASAIGTPEAPRPGPQPTGPGVGGPIRSRSERATRRRSVASSLRRLGAVLRTLTPGALLFNPIFQREMRTTGRGRIVYWMRGLYALLLLGLVATVFLAARSEAADQSGAAALQAMQDLAPIVTMTIAAFQYLALAFIAPVLTAPAIVDEKRARTLPELMTTPLNAAQILFGKLTSRTVQVLILALIATPLLLALRIFGGVQAEMVVAATCIALSTAVLAAALGLMYSVWHARAATAVMFAGFTLGLFQVGPFAVGLILASGRLPALFSEPALFATSSPAALVVLGEGWIGGGAGPDWRTVWRLNAGYNLVLAALMLAVATIALRRTMIAEAGGGAARPARRRWFGRLAGRGVEPLQAAPEARGTPEGDGERVRLADRSRDVGDRPVLWREMRQTAFGGRMMRFALRGWGLMAAGLGVTVLILLVDVGVEAEEAREGFTRLAAGREGALALIVPVALKWLAAASLWVVIVPRLDRGVAADVPKRTVLVAILTLAFLFLLYIRYGFGSAGVHGSIVIIGTLGALFSAVLQTTAGISGEREARTWDVLLSTPLAPRAIVLGKYAGAIRKQAFLPAIVAGHLVMAAALGGVRAALVVQALLVIVGPVLCLSATGLLLSLVLKRSTAAAVINLGAALFLWAGSWIVLALVHEFVVEVGPLFHANFAINPVAMVAAAIEGGTLDHPYRAPVPDRYWVGEDWTFTSNEFTGLVAGVFVGYAAVAAGALALAVRLFRRANGQPS